MFRGPELRERAAKVNENARFLAFLGVFGVFASGCALAPSGHAGVGVGTPGAGWVPAGVCLRDEGPGFVRARPRESTCFGTERLVRAIERASAAVSQRFGPAVSARIGDLGAPLGGAHPRHRSHRSGRDVDVLYFHLDASGEPVAPSGFVALDRFGIGRDSRTRSLVSLDVARTWTFVRSLLRDRETPVQWIFCSNGVKRLLLEHAATEETDAALLVRASIVLHQPTAAAPHDDHMHIRLACTADERALGCYDYGPVWPWLRRDHEKPSFEAGFAYDDETLVRALLEDDVIAEAQVPESR